MTPYELSILLEVYSGGEITANRSAPIFFPTMREFMDGGWVVGTADRAYTATDKLKTFIDFILNLPEPVQEWRMPERNP